jgi:hypothetical protein
MSALIRQSHANNTDPLWASAQGGENIVTDEIEITAGGSILFDKTPGGTQGTESGFVQANLPGQAGPTQYLALVQNAAGVITTDVLQCSNLYMNGGGALNTPTYLSFDGNLDYGLSYGTVGTRTIYLDSLSSGKAIITSNCVGPQPVLVSTAGPYAINPIPTAPAPFDYFGFGTAYPTTLGEEYDVYAMGTFGLVSGTGSPTIPDTMVVTFEVGGGGTGTGVFYFNPELPNWSVRARLVCNSSSPTIRVGCQNSQASGSTAVWSASCTLCDIVRVR